MRSSSYLAPALCILLFATCAEPPTAPENLVSPEAPLFKPKCDSPPCDGGEDPPEDPPPPPPSADQEILYSDFSRDFGSVSIFRMNVDGSNVEPVFGDDVESGNDNTHPAWAPDGERLTFTRLVRVLDKKKVVSTSHQIAVGRDDGTGPTVIREVPGGSVEPLYRPRWSPAPVGGVERIAWVENRWDAGQAVVVVARTDTWDVETLLTSGLDEHFGNMTWSRTGEQILVEGWYESSQQSFLRLYDVDCSVSCTATPAGDLSLSPLSSNDGFMHVDWAHLHDWVLVPAIPAGESFGDLWLIDMTTGDLHRVTQTSIDVQDAVWSSCDDAILIGVWGQFGRQWSNKLIRLNLAGLPAVTPWDGSLDDPTIAEEVADVGTTGIAGIDWRPTPCGS